MNKVTKPTPETAQSVDALPDVTQSVVTHSESAQANIALSITNLRKSFGGQVVLDDISVELRKGEIVLLRGDNGAGKTTLLNILTGNLNADAGTIETSVNTINERFCFPAPWWRNLNPFNHFTPERLSQEGIGRMWQEVRVFKSLNLRDNISLAKPNQIGENPAWALIRGYSWHQQENKTKAESEAMLDRLGLVGRGNEYADQISLGQSKRVAIARVVQAGAKILFLDEPLSGLDSQGMKEVLTLLEQLSASGNVTLVIVEHVFNIPHILNIATAVWTLGNGKLTKETPAVVQNQLRESNANDFQHLLDQFAGADGTVEELQLTNQARLSTIIPRGAENAAPVFEVRDLVVYRGKRLIIGEKREDGTAQGISFKLHKGQVSILHAPNGWGKSTLLEAISGLLPISQGQILIDGVPIERMSTCKRAALGLSLLRSRDNCFPTLTVKETLTLAGIDSVPAALNKFARKRTSELSGGERQRALVTAVLSSKNTLAGLLDEPFSALDPARVQELASLIRETLERSAILIAVPATAQEMAN